MRARTRYDMIAMLLHWSIAALILTNLFLGWRMSFLKGMAQFDMFQLHKSVGITVLVFSVCRLAWRLTHSAPALPATMRPWERAAAHAIHWFFYAMMIGMPLTGWAMVSTSAYNIPTLLWHTIPWPHIAFLHDQSTSVRAMIEARSGNIHMVLAYGGAALIAMHVAAALKHQFITRDGVLGRMVPGLDSAPSAL